jgi:hypothetical protein
MACYLMIKHPDPKYQKEIYDEIIADAKVEGIDTEDMELVIWSNKKNNCPPGYAMYVLWLSNDEQKWSFPNKTTIITTVNSPILNHKESKCNYIHVQDNINMMKSILFIYEDRIKNAQHFLNNLVIAI